MLEQESKENKKLIKQNLSLQFTQQAFNRLNDTLNEKKEECNSVKYQLRELLKHLSDSEYSISKFLKVIQDQDDLHEDQINFYKSSEELLRKYYEEKFKSYSTQIQIEKDVFATATAQTQNVTQEVKGELEQQLQKKSFELGKSNRIFVCYIFKSYNLEEST